MLHNQYEIIFHPNCKDTLNNATTCKPDTQLAFDLLAEDLEKRLKVNRPLADWRPLVARAIACRDWREFHLGLLGQTLEQKYLALSAWVEQVTLGGSSEEQRIVQVRNYVEALRRQRVLHVADENDARRI